MTTHTGPNQITPPPISSVKCGSVAYMNMIKLVDNVKKNCTTNSSTMYHEY